MLIPVIQAGLGALRAARLRTALTLLGNLVGVASVVTLASLVTGMNLYIREQVAREGANVVTVAERDEIGALADLEAFLRSFRNPPLTMGDHRFISERLASRHRVAARAVGSATAAAASHRIEDVRVEGWTGNAGDVALLALESGRLFTRHEVERSLPVCVVGSELAEKLEMKPDGGRIKVAGRHLRVIGQLEYSAGFPGQNPNRRVLVPITVFQKIFGARGSLTIPVRVSSVTETAGVIEELTALMRERHRLRPDQPDDFAVLTSTALVSLSESISTAVLAALLGLVSIALVVGGTVVMNTMLVAVAERSREIGLRRAVGARRGDIVSQFLTEAIGLSLLGGVAGVVTAWVVVVCVAQWTPIPQAIPVWSILAGLGATAGAGLLFGLYPAVRAARLDPVEALRHE